MKLAAKKFSILWGDETYGYYWSTLETGKNNAAGNGVRTNPRPFVFAAQLYYLIVLLAAAAGCWLLLKDNINYAAIFLMIFEGLVAAFVFLEVQPRYHFPVMPFFMIIAAHGVIGLKGMTSMRALPCRDVS